MRDRRQEILDAALEVFIDKGFDSATLADIRTRSGASTGSIYHAFAGKAEIAAALMGAATAGWQAAAPIPAGADAGTAIRASVTGLLRWGLAQPRQFAFLDDMTTRAGNSPDFAPVARMIAEGRARAGAMYASWRDAGQVRDLPWPVAYALMMGPAYTYLRIAGSDRAHADLAIIQIADAAWDAVRR